MRQIEWDEMNGGETLYQSYGKNPVCTEMVLDTRLTAYMLCKCAQLMSFEDFVALLTCCFG